jgi:hypothetical protein
MALLILTFEPVDISSDLSPSATPTIWQLPVHKLPHSCRALLGALQGNALLEYVDETGHDQNQDHRSVGPNWVLIALSGQVLLPVHECAWS